MVLKINTSQGAVVINPEPCPACSEVADIKYVYECERPPTNEDAESQRLRGWIPTYQLVVGFKCLSCGRDFTELYRTERKLLKRKTWF